MNTCAIVVFVKASYLTTETIISIPFGSTNRLQEEPGRWLQCTEMPFDATNQVDCFSGHYQCYGLNMQAMCYPDLLFLYAACAAPGKVNDTPAIFSNVRVL